MNESTLLTQLQAELLTLSTLFSSGDVVLNDWGILDKSTVNAPYILIEAPDTVNMKELNTDAPSGEVQIPFYLITAFVDWDTSKTDFVAKRVAVMDHLAHVEDYLPANGILSFGVVGINTATDVIGVYDHYSEKMIEALPIFLSQKFVITVEYPIL